ncbi:transposase [Pseudomonas cerasi]|nr:transposase [Pseudomonas cerasi]
MNSRKLGRTIHLMSIPERVFAQLALFNPAVFDLHEQKMLHIDSAVHPLFGHPLAVGIALQSFRGTSEVAARIGMRHARITVEDEGDRFPVPYNYIGDLLLYLRTEDGYPYAVNWSIKAGRNDFHERRRSTIKGFAQQRTDQEKARLRNLLEQEYYLDAGIHTHLLSLDDVPPMVAANLDLMYGYHDLPMDLDPVLLDDYSDDLLEKALQGTPPAFIAIEYAKKWGRRDLFLSKIYQDIWSRKLPVDLHSPILVDKPLCMRGKQLLEVYGHLFRDSPT